MSLPPKTFQDLFDFYNNYVKLLYSIIQAEHTMPVETLYELNAALDHIARAYAQSDSEEYAVKKAYSHLKRSCLDIFKILTKDIVYKYKELKKVDTSFIDNGDFEKNLNFLYKNLIKKMKDARIVEGVKNQDTDNNIKAFDLWEEAYDIALKIEEDYYFNKNISWARKKNTLVTLKTLLFSILTSIIAGFIIAFTGNEWINDIICYIKSMF